MNLPEPRDYKEEMWTLLQDMYEHSNSLNNEQSAKNINALIGDLSHIKNNTKSSTISYVKDSLMEVIEELIRMRQVGRNSESGGTYNGQTRLSIRPTEEEAKSVQSSSGDGATGEEPQTEDGAGPVGELEGVDALPEGIEKLIERPIILDPTITKGSNTTALPPGKYAIKTAESGIYVLFSSEKYFTLVRTGGSIQIRCQGKGEILMHVRTKYLNEEE